MVAPLIAVCEGLNGLPGGDHHLGTHRGQQCVVHLIRKSFRYAAGAPRRPLPGRSSRSIPPSRRLRRRKGSSSSRAVGAAVSGDRQVVGERLGRVRAVLEYDVEIGKVICSTNSIESISARCQPAVRSQGHFRTEAAALSASTW